MKSTPNARSTRPPSSSSSGDLGQGQQASLKKANGREYRGKTWDEMPAAFSTGA